MKKFLLMLLIVASATTYAQDVLKTCQVRSKCLLYLEPSSDSESIKLKKGESVDVMALEGMYYKVSHNGSIGYVLDVYIYDPELAEILKQKEAEKAAIKLAEEKEKELAKEAAARELKEQRAKEERQRKLAQAEADSIRAAEWAERQLERKKYLTTVYGKEKAQLIIEGKVHVGMTKNEALESWGTPSDINKTTTAYGVREQWVYRGRNYARKYLYFDNGVLKTIQE